jgi:hypothetical protein
MVAGDGPEATAAGALSQDWERAEGEGHAACRLPPAAYFSPGGGR